MSLCLQGPLLSELSMKSEYRCLVESVICSERKLAEAKAIQMEAREKLSKADGYVAYNEASLHESEQKLAELESRMLRLEA